MIISEYINLIIKNLKDINYLKKVEFNVDKINIGDEIQLPIKYLTNGSHKKVDVKCDNCGKINNMQYNVYKRICKDGKYYCNNKECINKKRELSIKEKYGVNNVFQIKDTKEKIRETLIKKYGNDNPQKIESIKKKSIETNIKRYGVDNPSKSEKIKNKIRQTNLKKYGVEYPQRSPEIRNKYSSLHRSSKIEKDLLKFIKHHSKNKVLNSVKNVIDGYELDIYIPELKLAFEFNGLYWHNELTKDKNYHLNKTELCESKGISLVHIYEDDWEFKSDIVKSMILNKLGKTKNRIFARKCVIKEITDNKLVREFLEHNHIQGFVGSKIKIGLFYKNDLVSLMTFGKKRKIMNSKSNDNDYEMIRFCSKIDTNVVGGAQKLFTYFKNYDPKSVTTYADRSWSNGNLYYNLGFEFKGKTSPNYYYIIDRKRKYRFGFRKDVLIKQGFNKDKSEREIMLERKIYRIYDSGNLKFIYNK
jgi:very-short-patch-repair endonuclease